MEAGTEVIDSLYRLIELVDGKDRLRILLDYGISLDEARVMRKKLPMMALMISETMLHILERTE